MSWLHQLSGGKSWRPPKSSVNATAPAPESDARGVGSAGAIGSTEPDGAEGVPPHPAITSSSEQTKRRMARPLRQETDQLVRAGERNLFPPVMFTQATEMLTTKTSLRPCATGTSPSLGCCSSVIIGRSSIFWCE